MVAPAAVRRPSGRRSGARPESIRRGQNPAPAARLAETRRAFGELKTLRGSKETIRGVSRLDPVRNRALAGFQSCRRRSGEPLLISGDAETCVCLFHPRSRNLQEFGVVAQAWRSAHPPKHTQYPALFSYCSSAEK